MAIVSVSIPADVVVPRVVPFKNTSRAAAPHVNGTFPKVAGGAVPSITQSIGTPIPVVMPARTDKVTFVSENGYTIRVPFAPSEMQIDNLAPVYSVLERPGKQELLLWDREQLTQVTLTVFIAAENQRLNPIGSVEQWITNFRNHVASRTRWRFMYGPQVDRHWWRFTDVSIKTQLRTPDTNEIAVATADIQLTQASDVSIRVGPITGGVPPSSGSGNGVAPGTQTYSTYTIKSASDTLWAIASRFLGSGARWKEIASLNNITDPRKIRVGQTIKIPGAR